MFLHKELRGEGDSKRERKFPPYLISGVFSAGEKNI